MQQSNYSDRKLMGYGLMQMNGLDYYVVDGNAATLFKAAFHQRVGSYTLTNPLTKSSSHRLNIHFGSKYLLN